jgi:hypothetical protein
MRGKQWQLRLSNRDERGRDAGGPAIMRLGANDGPDKGLNLIHSVRPVIMLGAAIPVMLAAIMPAPITQPCKTTLREVVIKTSRGVWGAT